MSSKKKTKHIEKEHDNLMTRSSILASLMKGEHVLHMNAGLIEIGGRRKNVGMNKRGGKIKKGAEMKKGGDYSVDPSSLTNYQGYDYYKGGNLGINYILNTNTNLMQGGLKRMVKKK